MRKFKQLLIIFLFFLPFSATGAPGYKPTLEVLTFINTLDADLVRTFEKKNNCNLRVEFVGNMSDFEPRIRSGLKSYDIVIADERSLDKLTIANLLKTLPEPFRQSEKSTRLAIKTKTNSDYNTIVPLYVNPVGIVYDKRFSNIPKQPTWDLLLDSEFNHFWRQKIFASEDINEQFIFALLATNVEMKQNSWFIPGQTLKWLKELRAQQAESNGPLYMSLLGNQVNAAIVFYSDFLRYQQINSNLEFFIPTNRTYFDRVSIGWVSTSAHEELSENFIKFIYEHRTQLAKNHKYPNLDTEKFLNVDTSSWVIFQPDKPIPKWLQSKLQEIENKTEL